MMKKFKKFTKIYVVVVQKFLLAILLTLLYIFGFGLTKIFVLIFRTKLFPRKLIAKNSFWEVIDYHLDKRSFLQQV